jgi:PST family polysaccharide transporter
LKRKTARGALSSVGAQVANLVLRIGSMVILARLVTPESFGLVGMVAALIGFLGLFRDAGLSQATIQRATITAQQTSALFWINFAIGLGLALFCATIAPAVALFYGDDRLLWITVALGLSFVFSGASAQHRALLQREMRLGTLAGVELFASAASVLIGIAMAAIGMGYWALVAMAVSAPAIGLVGMWGVTGWIPGMPRRGSGVGPMLHYGGLLTLNGVVVYVAYNLDKVLLGRVWGAEVLGTYGRAYQLISIPTENLHSTIGLVMFPALSRVQDDPARLRSYFLKGYGLFLSVVMPITVASALFADLIVRVLLGPQWSAAVSVFQLLAPTILALALINPMAYLMQATGKMVRSLQIALLIAPVVITGYVLGLPAGANGVAVGFSIAMSVLVVPVVLWATHGTMITGRDLLRTAWPPLASTTVAAALAYALGEYIGDINPLLKISLVSLALFGVQTMVLYLAMGYGKVYAEVLEASGLRKRRGESGARNDEPR